MKVLICSNGPWPQGDHRTAWAFDELVARGDVSSYVLISQGQHSLHERQLFFSEVEKQVNTFKPDVILWHKDDGSDLNEDWVENLSKSSILVYHDMDPWTPFIKPSRPNQHLLAKHARRIVLVGLGPIARQFSQGGTRIRYMPHGYCDIDIPDSERVRERKLVFVANVSKRWGRLLGPFAPEQHPGRTKHVGVLRGRLGERFVVHGKGYPAAWGINPCTFDDQFRLSTTMLATFANDAAPGASGYFSNRTPFALACGSAHLKIHRPNDEFYFRGCPGIILVKNGHEAADAFEMLCSWSEEELCKISEASKEFAKHRFRMPDLYRTLLREAVS